MVMFTNKIAIISTIILTTFINSLMVFAADDVSLTGTWESQYDFGAITEVVTASVQQAGENLIGSFSAKQSPSGDTYLGKIFGTVTYYYQDSDMASITGPYEAKKV